MKINNIQNFIFSFVLTYLFFYNFWQRKDEKEQEKCRNPQKATHTHTHTHTQLKRCLAFLVSAFLSISSAFSTTLPSGYTELEYIESTGTQYIDTGYYTNANTWVHADIMSLESGNKNWWGGSLASAFIFNIQTDWSYGSAFEYKYGGLEWNRFRQDDIPNNVFSIDFGKNKKIYVNNEIKVDLSGVSKGIDSAPLWIFLRNGGSAKIKGRLYVFKIYENDNLIMDLIPAKNSGNVIGLYDTVNNVFYTNSGTGTFTAGPNKDCPPTVHINWGGVELDSDDPSGTCVYGGTLTDTYTQLEYIASSTTQYINTGIIADDATGFYIDAQKTYDNSTDSIVFGSRTDTNDSRCWLDVDDTGIAGRMLLGWGIYTPDVPGRVDINLNRFKAKINYMNDRQVVINGVNEPLYTSQLESTLPPQTSPLYILGANTLGHFVYGWYGRVYNFQITQGSSNLIANFIPAKRNSDNAVGMYDTIRKRFYGNSGTGTIIAGPEIFEPTPSIVNINWGGVELDSDDPSRTCVYGETLSVPSVTPTPPNGYKFLGWIPL